MTSPIRIGDIGTTLSPMKPTGRVSVNGQRMDASSEGAWIDSGVDIVIVGGNTRQAIVRELCKDPGNPQNHGEPLLEVKAIQTPLQSPPARVEQINSVVVGLVIGVVLMPVVWLTGTPFSLDALLVPLAGAVAGWIFRMFLAMAVDSAGPREDHRPRATGIALLMLLCCIVGSVITINAGFGFLGLCFSLPFGAFLGGVVSGGLLLLEYL